MTVQELIEKLQTFDPRITVLVDNGSVGAFEPRIEFVGGDVVVFPND